MIILKAFPKKLSSSAMNVKLVTSVKHTPPICHYVLRNLSSGNPLMSSSKRKIQTGTVWQPHAFNFEPPPTLVPGIPKTAASGPKEQRNDLRPLAPIDQYDTDKERAQILREDAKLMEESEKNSSSLEAKPRSKLRARKAAIRLTPDAVNHLRKLLDQPSPKLIKIGVRNRGCSGLAYHLEYVDKAGLLDEEVEQDGVKVIIDSKALFSIIGSEMDWIEDKLQQKFVFNNPNIKEQCGCGESFMV